MGLDHVFFDISAGDPWTSLAAVRTNERGKTLAATSIDGGSFEALAANVHDAVVASFSAPYIVVASDLTKRALLEKCCSKIKREILFARRRWIDFEQFTWPLAMCDQVPNRTLVAAGVAFGVTNTHPGTVSGDCAFLAETYWQIARRYRAGLTAEAFVRNAGGSTLAVARRMFGV